MTHGKQHQEEQNEKQRKIFIHSYMVLVFEKRVYQTKLSYRKKEKSKSKEIHKTAEKCQEDLHRLGS